MRSTSTKKTKHNSINTNNLLAGDILLYSANDPLGKNIADSTNGYFSHAAIYVGCSEEREGEILHTGPEGAVLVNCKDDFSRDFSGVFVVRVSSTIDKSKLYQLAIEQQGKEYDFRSLKYIGLAALDRRTLDNGTGVYRFLPKKIGKAVVKIANRIGSRAVCSGLSISLLNEASKEDVFPETVVALDQLSPNCIYDEALKESNKTSVYELVPLSEEEISRDRKNIFLAGLSLKKSN